MHCVCWDEVLHCGFYIWIFQSIFILNKPKEWGDVEKNITVAKEDLKEAGTWSFVLNITYTQ